MTAILEPEPLDVVSRRVFLQLGMAGAAAWAACRVAHSDGTPQDPRRRVILICNLGGPSQLDSWDPKPAAPAEVRGPFRAIRTTVPGLHVSELFPRHAQLAHHLALVRSCFHPFPALHHVGWQCMQTGRAFTGQWQLPHVGCLAGYLLGRLDGLPPHVVLPQPLRGIERRQAMGQSAGCLGAVHDPLVAAPRENQRAGVAQDPDQALVAAALDLSHESAATRAKYGDHPLGRCCLAARRLVEAGVRCVTVNTSTDVLRQSSWDTHGHAPFATTLQLREQVAPQYDQAVSSLIQDLHQRGQLEDTLICALAEFGRTPRMNPQGGRDHWPQCFTTYFAGGGVQGGQVIGASDRWASQPADRPVSPPEIVASILSGLGVPPHVWQRPFALPDQTALNVQPVWELF